MSIFLTSAEPRRNTIEVTISNCDPGVNVGDWVAIGTGQNVYSNDLTFGKPIMADTEHPLHPAWQAIDDNYNSAWYSELFGSFPHWLVIDFINPEAIEKFTVRSSIHNGNLEFKDFIIQGTNTDPILGPWNDIYTGQCANSFGEQEFVFNNPTSYRWYRVYVTSSWGTRPVTTVQELQMMRVDSIINPGIAVKAKADSKATTPTVGVVISKPSPTKAKILTEGEYRTAGLIPGSTYWLSDMVAGVIQNFAPTQVDNFIQSVGIAYSDTILYIDLETTLIQL